MGLNDVNSDVDSSPSRQARSSVNFGPARALPVRQPARRSRLAAERPSESYVGRPTSTRNSPIPTTNPSVRIKRTMSAPPELQDRVQRPRTDRKRTSPVPFTGFDAASENSPGEAQPSNSRRRTQSISQESVPPQAPVPDAPPLEMLQHQLQNLQALLNHFNFLPHLSDFTKKALMKLMTEAIVPQVPIQGWKRVVYGMLWEILVSQIKVLAAPGPVNLFGQQQFADMHRLNYLPQDISPVIQLLDVYDDNSKDRWMPQLIGFPGDNIERDLVQAVQEHGWDFAIQRMNLGLILDYKAMKPIISASIYLTQAERTFILDFLRTVVDGVAAAKASDVGQEHTECAILAARLLFMALRTILYQDVPDWMEMMLQDDNIRPALALMMVDDDRLPVSDLNWETVEAIVYAVAMKPELRYDWFRELIAGWNADGQQP